MRKFLKLKMQSFFASRLQWRKGLGILLSIGALSVVTATISYFTFRKMTNAYSATIAQSLGLQSEYLAQTGLDTAIRVLRSIPQEYLHRYKFLTGPPSLKLGESCNEQNICRLLYTNYKIRIADGKLNLNNLVRNDDEVNQSFRLTLSRLFNQLDIPDKSILSLVDWMDRNDKAGLLGAEKGYYAELRQKIKNNYLFSLSELNLVRDFTEINMDASREPPDWKPDVEELAYLGQIDWTVSHNVTAFLPYTNFLDGKVNINAAPFFVLMSLSDFMTRRDVREIMKLREQNDGYISDLEVLRPMLENREGYNELSLFEEIVGTGGNLSGQLRTDTHFYELISRGIVIKLDKNSGEQSIISERRITALWDVRNTHIVAYVKE